MNRKNPLEHLSDDELVAEHTVQGANSHHLSEMLRRHKKVTEKLGRNLWWLNLLLLLFTIAIAVLTAVEVSSRWIK
jgi:quinol-cytochrome oxidoreductase complex cytochrome b subunit